MPIYELHCESCGHEFEELVFRRSEIDEVACPACGTKKAGLLLSSFATGGKSPGGSGGGGSCGSGGGGCGSGGFT